MAQCLLTNNGAANTLISLPVLLFRYRIQTVAIVGVITALTLVLALPKDDRKKKKEKNNIDSIAYDNPDLNNYAFKLDSYGEVIDLSNYKIYDYGDLASKGILCIEVVCISYAQKNFPKGWTLFFHETISAAGKSQLYLHLSNANVAER